MRGYVYTYSPRAKEKIRNCLVRFLEEAQAEHCTDNILTILDELIKNGIKGNYKYIDVIEHIGRHLYEKADRDLPSLAEILRNPRLYNEFVTEHISIDNKENKIRSILNQEAASMKIRLKAMQERRKFTEEERKKISGFKDLINARKKSRIYGLNLLVTMHEDHDILILEVINSAPILQNDLIRIKEKRKSFAEYAERGEEALFFIENMDGEKAGSGLGYGTIDSSLRDMGLDPEEHLTIISTANTTIMLTIDYKRLREGGASSG